MGRGYEGNPNFGGTPLIMGEIFGLRSFNYDKLGRLLSINQGTIFTPGTNEAICTSDYGRTKHEIDNCSCGFYSFTNGTDHYDNDKARIDGVIKQYGRTVIGELGARSEKAEIVALYMPSASRHNRIFRWYQRHSVGATSRVPIRNVVVNGILGGLAAVTALVFTFIFLFTGNPALFLSLPLAVALGFNSFYGILAETHPHKPRERYCKALAVGDKGIHEKIRANYPDVKIYSSKRKMKADHKNKEFAPEVPEIISPETREDFWEMKA